MGLLPWVIIFISEHNWIAAAVEAGGAPAMLMGLSIAWRGQRQESRWLDHFTKLAVFLGLGLSFYDFGGITTLNQVLELGIASGFLIGTYLLAKEKPHGYIRKILLS